VGENRRPAKQSVCKVRVFARITHRIRLLWIIRPCGLLQRSAIGIRIVSLGSPGSSSIASSISRLEWLWPIIWVSSCVLRIPIVWITSKGWRGISSNRRGHPLIRLLLLLLKKNGIVRILSSSSPPEKYRGDHSTNCEHYYSDGYAHSNCQSVVVAITISLYIKYQCSGRVASCVALTHHNNRMQPRRGSGSMLEKRMGSRNAESWLIVVIRRAADGSKMRLL
jgi:hypothetical protein